jgi:hypothetical protein
VTSGARRNHVSIAIEQHVFRSDRKNSAREQPVIFVGQQNALRACQPTPHFRHLPLGHFTQLNEASFDR